MGNRTGHTRTVSRLLSLVLGSLLLAGSWGGRFAGAEAGTVGPSVLDSVPRRAVLVVYCPNARRLAEAWESIAGLRDLKDWVLGGLGARLERIDETFVRRWADRLELEPGELSAAVAGEALIGWMPRVSATDAAFDAREWVFVGCVEPAGESAIRRLWSRAVERRAPGGRVSRRQLGDVSIEQVVWEETLHTRVDSPAPPRIEGRSDDEPPDRIVRGEGVGDLTRVEQRAMSIGLGGGRVYFTPSRSESLEPWLAAGSGPRGAVRATERMRALIAQTRDDGEIVLALQARPPAWVPPVESAGEHRLGTNPVHVLLSQVRAIELALTRRGGLLRIDAQAMMLPPPGWLARLLGPLEPGASRSLPDDGAVEVVVRADVSRLWQAFREVLAEGWPAVGAAIDTLLAPLGESPGAGPARVAATLGPEVRLRVCGKDAQHPAQPRWALAFDLRDSEGFARCEPQLVRLLETFAPGTVTYEVAPDGALRERVQMTTAVVSQHARRLHVARSPSRFVVAGSRGALAVALQGVPRQQTETPALAIGAQGQQPSVLVHYESSAGETVGDGVRRIVRGPSEAIVLISPPPEGGATNAAAPAPTGDAVSGASPPVGRLAARLTVESPTEVRLEIGLQIPGRDAAASLPPRPPTGKGPVIQE